MSPVHDDLNNRKRGRDDDCEDVVFGNGPLSFQEHRNKQKRVQHMPLPLRSSPPRPAPQLQSHFSPWTSSPMPSPHTHTMPEQPVPQEELEVSAHQVAIEALSDMDMDMAMDTHLSPGPMQPDSGSMTAASPINNHHANALANRMPTPIQPSFAAQVHPRVQDRSIGGQAVGAASMGAFDSSAVPRTMEAAEWAQTRRLPSPISEGGDADFPASPGMVLDSNYGSQQGSPRSNHHLAHMHHEHPHIHEMEQRVHEPDEDVGMEVDGLLSDTPSPPRKGHTRSRHTLSSWTLKPGMKKSFSIGYRSDCEKCRQKVPGHFNHIIIS
ncbi:hypothetical protein MKZ38_005732 [Zalerion maritima]|uniref:Uncharacterized protein n=1 Tax=Zalerion maritima TaxID=339359 RepID=A0AAD5WQ36_9PEZI|nr:hypothetical protein MKZ38_005732 [Zalerion maritima]